MLSQALFLRGVWDSVSMIPGVPLGAQGFRTHGDSLALQPAEEGVRCPEQLWRYEEGGDIVMFCLGSVWCILGTCSSRGMGKAVVWHGTVFP